MKQNIHLNPGARGVHRSAPDPAQAQADEEVQQAEAEAAHLARPGIAHSLRTHSVSQVQFGLVLASLLKE